MIKRSIFCVAAVMAAFSFGINAEAQTTGKVRVPNQESGQSLTITPPYVKMCLKALCG